jgi:hypothetical protein
MGTIFTMLVFSYDIVCQWFRNLRDRIPQLPKAMRISPRVFVNIRYVIPKFHIYSHGSSCQHRFSLNFLRWSARTNGEDIERWWAHANPVSMSTKEMAPGSRTDTIDDHAAAWNFRKIVRFGKIYIDLLCGVSNSNFHRFVSSFALQEGYQDASKASGLLRQAQPEVHTSRYREVGEDGDGLGRGLHDAESLRRARNWYVTSSVE